MGDSNMQADSQGTSSFQESIDDSWVSALVANVQQSSEWGSAFSSARGRLMELVSQKNGMLFSDLNGEQRMALIDELEVDMWDKDDYSQFAGYAASKVRNGAVQLQRYTSLHMKRIVFVEQMVCASRCVWMRVGASVREK
jgi:hypothetical protein